MNRSAAGLAVYIPKEGFSAGPALDALRAIAQREKCSVLGDFLPPAFHRGKQVQRPTLGCFFPVIRDGEPAMAAFLIAESLKQGEVDPSSLPVNRMTLQELQDAA